MFSYEYNLLVIVHIRRVLLERFRSGISWLSSNVTRRYHLDLNGNIECFRENFPNRSWAPA